MAKRKLVDGPAGCAICAICDDFEDELWELLLADFWGLFRSCVIYLAGG